ncbi:GH-E family nuclease [Avibacterium avium]|uniref:GH-E family nuclease n=1 Tax=Avibacterium avium TaxID=751 RepID=UPI003BF857E6
MYNSNNDCTKLENGDYYHAASDTTIKGPIDIGHTYGWEHRRLSLAAKELKMTQKEFNDYVNARPKNFRLENRLRNQSHYDEMPGKDDIQRIKEDMQMFLKMDK